MMPSDGRRAAHDPDMVMLEARNLAGLFPRECRRRLSSQLSGIRNGGDP